MNRREVIRNTAIFLGAASVGGTSILMQSCKPSLVDNWKPIFLTEEESITLAEIAETMIPKTDTPGAKEALVERYLDEYASKFLKPEEQITFKAGLGVFDTTSNSLKGKTFSKLADSDKSEVLQSMIDNSETGENSPSEIFYQMREAVTMAFFTSEIGATQVLDNQPIPGEYIGDMPISETKGKVYS